MPSEPDALKKSLSVAGELSGIVVDSDGTRAGLALDEDQVRRVLRLSQRLGHTEQIAHDHFFDRQVVREMVAIMVDIAAGKPQGWFVAADLRDRLDNGRKVAIQILDFFDRLGLTRRRGDRRRLNPHRLDLYDN